MINIFSKEFHLEEDLNLVILYEAEVNAGQVPSIIDNLSTVKYTEAVKTELHAHDIVVRVEDKDKLYSYVGEFCKDSEFQVFAMSSDFGTCLLRFYKKIDWPCAEHPELLHGAALGQYHCPYCGEMQMAGMLHLPKDLDTDSV